jgi:hypothetical protein
LVQRPAEVFIDGCGLTREGFIGGALARGEAALAALSAALIGFKTEPAIAPFIITAPRAWRGYPVMIVSVVVALHANGHARKGTSTLFLFNIGSCCFPVETPKTRLQKGLVWGGNGFAKRARGSRPRIRKVGGRGVGDGFARCAARGLGVGFAKWEGWSGAGFSRAGGVGYGMVIERGQRKAGGVGGCVVDGVDQAAILALMPRCLSIARTRSMR